MPKKIINLNRVLTALAIIGILSGLWMVIKDQKKAPVSQPAVIPSTSPYESFISASGIIEAKSENLNLGTIVGGAVDKVLVEVGDKVKKGQPLFTLDMREAQADVALKLAQFEESKTALEQARANLKSSKDNLGFLEKVSDKRAIAQEDLTTRQNAVFVNEAALKNAEAILQSAKKSLEVSETTLSLYTIRAPLDCEILQVNIHPGEYAAAAVLTTPLMLIGSVQDYHVRVQIDENEAWRFKKESPAEAILRGNIHFKTPLQFKYIEPYVIPKQSLTGDATERVDTRVLEVVYAYDPETFPGYMGQQVDVYIKADKIPASLTYGGPGVPVQ
ncbi:RND family efflux transporter [Candidatus Bealeia paramacronuclearis]|uniref:RND family efflux transporter n=1 Tax=Candidatus Bealeia paramacronuclearis TaxID=1921001 RepID=A0ABZ2C658_9PROT|nr:RND family efflux transporter [Candidatus Bealeia paramacronuclearis]